MKIKLYQTLERVFSWIAEHAETLRERFAICPDCGENRYTGKPCVKL